MNASAATTLPVAARPALSQRAREALGLGSLVSLTAAGAAIAICAAGGTSFIVPASYSGMPAWLAGPMRGLGPTLTADQFVIVLAIMSAFYAATLAFGRALPVRWIVVAIVLLHVLFAISPPIMSKDIFSYISYARLGIRHGADPYNTGAFQYPGDAAYPYLGWRHTGSAYGPLFTLASYPLGLVGVPFAMWVIKIFTAAASLGMVRLVWVCAKRLGRSPLDAIVWVGLNPLLLVYGVGGGHNDLIMLFGMLLAVTLVLIPREGSAAAAVVAAAAVKASAAVMLPFMLLHASDRRRSVLAAAGAGIAVLALSAAAFSGHALGVASVLKRQQLLVSGDAIPTQLGKLAGLSGVTSDVRLVARLITMIAIAGLCYLVWRGMMDWITATGWGLITIVVASSWLLGWYPLWPVPFAALSTDRRLRIATFALFVYFVVMRWTIFIK
ncbi:MAG: polyprenol phosphomannose-dependent alpha 1,6 mannosyltransferase MptB [Solirubrobacteraceae bacterium]